MTAAAAVDVRPDTNDMVMVHRVFRREFRLLPGFVAAVPTGDVALAKRVAAHASELVEILHHHHATEDELLWPRLLERVSMHSELVKRMQAQHERVAALLEQAQRLLPVWSERAAADVREALSAVLGDISSALGEHLDEEERSILPLAAEHLSAGEWAEFGQRGFAAVPKNRRLVILGAILEEAAPDEAQRFLSHVPPPARMAYRLMGKRLYQRAILDLRKAIPAQRTA